MRTPVLIFDFGNVVAYFDYHKAAERIGQRIGLSGPKLLELVRARGLTDIVNLYESGRISCSDFSTRVCALAGVELTHDEFVAAWEDIFWVNPTVADLVRRLKEGGYTLLLGSNTNAIHAGHFRRQLEEHLAPFDRLMLSYEIGHIKPSADFYLACAEAAGARPADCVFIDDLPENVAGARAAGLAAIHYQDDTPRLIAELRELGVEVPRA